MNSTCHVTANSTTILSFFILGSIFAIIGCILNIASCLVFFRSKSLFNTAFAIFIIALSISDIIKLIAEYFLHLLFVYIQHPYFVCSITWFLTMTSENTSYMFLCALGIERNLKLWTNDHRWMITRQRACWITLFIVILLCIYDHPFLYWPSQASFCYFTLFNYSMIYTCSNAYYHAYGYSFSLTKLIEIETVGLNNLVLPLIIIFINIILIIGLKRHRCQQQRLCKNSYRNWKEQGVPGFIFLSSILFIFLTCPVGILVFCGIVSGKKIPTNNLILIGDLMEIIHHCSHFPILLLTSSRVRRQVFPHRYRRRTRIQSLPLALHIKSKDHQETYL